MMERKRKHSSIEDCTKSQNVERAEIRNIHLDIGELQSIFSSEPIFIIGYPRSGTTLLRLMIDAHPHISIPPESHFIISTWKYRHRYGDLSVIKNYQFFLSEIFRNNRYFEWGLPEEVVKPIMWQIPAEKRNYSMVYRTLFSLYALLNKKLRWGDKTPSYIWYVFELNKLFPDAKFIHIVRDPRAIAASYQRLGWGRPLPTVHEWKASLRRIESFGKQFPEKLICIRYEDPVREPERILRQICAFLYEPFVEDMLRYYENADRRLPESRHRVHPHITDLPDPQQATKWKNQLTLEVISVIEAICKELNDRYSYEKTDNKNLGIKLQTMLIGSTISFYKQRILSSLHEKIKIKLEKLMALCFSGLLNKNGITHS